MWFVNFVRFTVFTVAGLTIRKTWNWMIEDIDPMPGTKKFNSELLNAEAKHKRLKRKKEEYDDTLRKVR